MKRAELTGVNQPLELVNTDIPTPPADGCLLKTTYAGICHSDLHLIEDHFNLGGDQKMVVSDVLKMRGIDPWNGRVLGHEIAGTIVSFGSNADPAHLGLAIGDHVLAYPWIGCGSCSVCEAGVSPSCPNDPAGSGFSLGVGKNPGGFSTHVPVPKCSNIVKLPDNISGAVGCTLPCSGLTAYTALKKAVPNITQAFKKFGQVRLLIVGGGGVGLWATKLSKVMFKEQNVDVYVADISQKSLDLAKQAGADHTILWDPKADTPTSVAKTTSGGEAKIDTVIDFVGGESTAGIALHCLRPEGIVVVVGLFGGAITFPLPVLIFGMLSIQGSFVGTQANLEELVDLVAANDIQYPSQELVTLDDINQAIDKLKAGMVKGRAVIKYVDI